MKVGAFDVSKVSKFEVTFGGMAYKAHACLGCHTIEENGKLIGGPQSTALQNAGQRYNLDWLYRFGQNPQDFITHTGEFLADATDPQLRAVIGFLAAQGVKDFKYYEPWTSQEFANASVDRGKVCTKNIARSATGSPATGDGPAASGLEPKPAIHANIPFEKLPIDVSLQRDQSWRRGDGEIPEHAVLELDDRSAGRGRCDGVLESDL